MRKEKTEITNEMIEAGADIIMSSQYFDLLMGDVVSTGTEIKCVIHGIRNFINQSLFTVKHALCSCIDHARPYGAGVDYAVRSFSAAAPGIYNRSEERGLPCFKHLPNGEGISHSLVNILWVSIAFRFTR